MTKLVAINDVTHRNLKIDPGYCLAQQSNTHLIPIVIDEFRQLCGQYPLVLAKNSESGGFICTALMGLAEGENLFVNNGILHAACMPLNLSRQPFYLSLGEDTHLSVCVDMDHPSVGQDKGTAIFEQNGEQSKLLQDISAILATLYHGDKKNREFIDHLVSLDLIMPMRLNITLDDDSRSEVNGLYTIDEEALARLNTEQLESLHKKDHLRFIYTMIASLAQIQMMVHRKNRALNND